MTKQIDETVTTCDSDYATRALGGLTLTNLGAAFPKQLLTVVIYKAGLGKFTGPDKTYLNKKVYVTSKLVLWKTFRRSYTNIIVVKFKEYSLKLFFNLEILDV